MDPAAGDIGGNRKLFGASVAGVNHLRHKHDLAHNAFTKGQPEHAAEPAEDLERLVTLHEASPIAAAVIEPMAGSSGVLMPPKGIANGCMPAGAAFVKHGIRDAFLVLSQAIIELPHGHNHSGHQMAGAAALPHPVGHL